MNLVTIENAIQAAIKAGSGNVTTIWANQDRTRPARPFVSLEVISSTPVGQFAENTTSGINVSDTITLTASQHVELAVAVTAFTNETYGNSGAANLLQKVRLYLGHETALSALEAADIALIEAGPVQDLSKLWSTEFEGQAVLNLRLRVRDSLAEEYPYIGQAEITSDIEDVEQVIDVTLP